MPKFIVCPECEGTGSSSAYLGAFTSEEMWEQGDEFVEDYIAGRYDRNCDECKGQRVVAGCKVEGCNEPVAVVNGYFGRTVGTGCFDHDEDAQSAAETEAMSAAERRFGC